MYLNQNSTNIPQLQLEKLFEPSNLWDCDSLFARNKGVPKMKGIYCWYFKNIPPFVPLKDCFVLNGLTLLYGGVAPVDINSKNTLRQRLRSHFKGNASGSTLRLSLGCLLSNELNITLRKTGTTDRLTYGEGEQKLSNWMGENCRVSWVENNEPWILEKELFKQKYLPLNIDDNPDNDFAYHLLSIRKKAKEVARNS